MKRRLEARGWVVEVRSKLMDGEKRGACGKRRVEGEEEREVQRGGGLVWKIGEARDKEVERLEGRVEMKVEGR